VDDPQVALPDDRKAVKDGDEHALRTVTQVSGNTLTGGTWNIFANATLSLNNGANLTQNNGSVTLNGVNAVFANLNNLATNNGSFAILAGRNFTTVGDFSNAGTLTVGTGGTFQVTGNLTNFSGTTLTGGSYVVSGTLQFPNANIVTNAASIVLDGSAAQIIDQAGVDGLRNFATNAAEGRFTIQNGANLTTAGDFSNLGYLTLGPASTFIVTGDFTQGTAATLEVQLGGNPADGLFGQLVVTGVATLDGTLQVSLVNGSSPSIGDSFQILTFGSRVGDFAALVGLDLGDTILDPQYGDHSLTLVTQPHP
jgi:hypothetical protein